jgi:hypothetical protein
MRNKENHVQSGLFKEYQLKTRSYVQPEASEKSQFEAKPHGT